MSFLLIQNPVHSNPDVELMSTLGLSGSRGNDGRIGFFGSGFPYSLALLARHGLLERTKICLGTSVFTFSIDRKHARTASGSRVDASTIVMKKQNGPTYPLNISINFGEVDWKSVTLAIREFISNSIDGTYEFGGTPSKDVVIDTSIPDEPRMLRAKDGFIRVYIPLCDEIQEYVDELHKYFRCLAPGYSPDRTVLINTDGGPARVYRKGVLVGKFGDHSLFNYNINDIEINESRQVDSWTAKYRCAQAIAKCKNAGVISRYLASKLSNASVWEKDFDVDYLTPGYASYDDSYDRESSVASFTDSVKSLVGHKVVCTSEIAARIVLSKGLEPLHVDTNTATVLQSYGAKMADSVLNRNELEGRVISDATPDAQRMLDHVWNVLCTHNLTLGKDKPGIKCFHQHSTECGMSGYYRPGDSNIYLRSDYADGITSYGMNTVLHELNHWITGADDLTHEFTDFAHKVAVALMMQTNV